MIVDRLFDRALPWIASHRLSIPDSISKLRSNQRSLDLYSNPSLLCHAVMVHSYIFSLILLGCGLWICTCITSAVSISSIYFGSILQIFFISNNNSILHRSSRSVYCSFSSCGIGFPSSPYLFSLPFIQEILPLNYVCVVLPILTCLLFLFVLPLPGVPSLFLFHLIPYSILELDGSC